MRFDTVSSLMDGLRHSRMLSVAQINEIKVAILPWAADPETFSDLLVRRGILTAFQAEHILPNSDEPLQLGPYRLLDLLGEGGLCKVYKALHLDFQQIVALKIVHPEFRSNLEVVD